MKLRSTRPNDQVVNALVFDIIGGHQTIEGAADVLVAFHQGEVTRALALTTLTDVYREMQPEAAPSW